MAEIFPPATKAVDLPPVVTELMEFHERCDSDPWSTMDQDPAAFTETVGGIMSRHDLDPDDIRSQRIAQGIRLITLPVVGEQRLSLLNKVIYMKEQAVDPSMVVAAAMVGCYSYPEYSGPGLSEEQIDAKSNQAASDARALFCLAEYILEQTF